MNNLTISYSRAWASFFLFLGCMFLSGCGLASLSRVHPAMKERMKGAETIMVMPPEISVFQIAADGRREKVYEGSGEAKKNIRSAIRRELAMSGYLVTFFDDKSLTESEKANFEDTAALFNAVSSAIVSHTHNKSPNYLPGQTNRADYTLGREVQGLSRQSDALLFVQAVDHNLTGGRKAVETGAMLLGILAGYIMPPQGGITDIRMALVDTGSGDIMWYSCDLSRGKIDLRNQNSAARLVKGLFKSFPLSGDTYAP